MREFSAWLASACLLLGAAAPGLSAQQASALTRISASAKDAFFFVDGQSFTGAASLNWPAGSKHILEIPPWQYAAGWTKVRYTFQHWSTPAGPLPSPAASVAITADPAVPWYNADLTAEYAISLNFFQCPDAPCASPGTVWVNQVAYTQNADVWAASGSSVTLYASPNPGFVFDGWVSGPSAAMYSFVVKQAITVYPRFAVARAIRLLTSPDGLQLLADRAPVTAPATLDWGFNTSHTLGVVSPQWDQHGRLWMFRSWSDGGSLTHAYQVSSGAEPLSLMAQFVRAVPVAIETSPPGLDLTIDGVAAASPRNLFWAAGDSHTVNAPLRQTDAAGGPWVFRSWSNGAAGAQIVTVADSQVETGIRLTAVYDPLSRIHIDSTPGGLDLAVDGANCRTPCEVERPVGTTVSLRAPASLPFSDGARLEFSSWDGAEGGTLSAQPGYHKVTARYRTSYRLLLRTAPADAALWRLAPASGDGFYPAGAAVSIGVDPASGMRFDRWELDLSGSANPATLVMDAPHAVEARFERLPERPAPPRVMNAAGDTPSGALAPGSIASLFGTNLSDETAAATTDPLPQGLAGVTLRCAGRLLPLLYVSPRQINFQIPSGLAPGQYRLEVLRGNAAVTQVDFQVARNAPGLLLGAHSDGAPITPEAPAHPGEQVVLYGTGLGPFAPQPLDGFRVASTPVFALVDPVEVLLRGRVLGLDSAEATPGTVGLAALRIRLPEDLDSSAPLTIMVRVEGVESNSLVLPAQ